MRENYSNGSFRTTYGHNKERKIITFSEFFSLKSYKPHPYAYYDIMCLGMYCTLESPAET